MEILRVENLTKIYGKDMAKVIALDNVSFSVEKGEFVCIIGASGSGKSTLLHLIGGVDRPTSGKVYINEKDIYSLNNDNLAIFRRRQVGLIYQFYNLIPILNVEENITLPSRLDGKEVKKEKINEILTTLRFRKEKKPSSKSVISEDNNKEFQFGRAIVNEPAIMLADEPTRELRQQSFRRNNFTT